MVKTFNVGLHPRRSGASCCCRSIVEFLLHQWQVTWEVRECSIQLTVTIINEYLAHDLIPGDRYLSSSCVYTCCSSWHMMIVMSESQLCIWKMQFTVHEIVDIVQTPSMLLSDVSILFPELLAYSYLLFVKSFSQNCNYFFFHKRRPQSASTYISPLLKHNTMRNKHLNLLLILKPWLDFSK